MPQIDNMKFAIVHKDYVLDYTSPLQNVLMETESGDGGLTYRYTYGLQKDSVVLYGILNGVGSVVQTFNYPTGPQNIVKLYYHHDHLGSTDYLTDNITGRVTSYVTYDDWGKLTAKAVVQLGVRELDLVQEYTGHSYDQVLGLYYAKARMYDAADRRFMARDIYKGDIRNPLSLSQYIYCLDNPTIFVDLLGLYIGDRPVLLKGANKEYSNTTILPNGKKETLKDLTFAYLGYVNLSELISDVLNPYEYPAKIEKNKVTKMIEGRITSLTGQVTFSFSTEFTNKPDTNMNLPGAYCEAKGGMGYFHVLSCEYSLYVKLKSFAKAAGFGIGLRFYVRGEGELPVSGYEPAYDAYEWNEYWIQDYRNKTMYLLKNITNCYAYAMDWQKHPINNSFKIPVQPGELSDSYNLLRHISDYSEQKSIDALYQAARLDAWEYGYGKYGSGADFAKSDKWEKAPAGMYKVALALTESMNDYHWYRQNPDGTWSHKPGTGLENIYNVSNTDSNGQLIIDPEKAYVIARPGGKYTKFDEYYITGIPR